MEIINDMTQARVIELLNFFEETGNDSALLLGKEKTEELQPEIVLMGIEGYIDVEYEAGKNNKMQPYPISWKINENGRKIMKKKN